MTEALAILALGLLIVALVLLKIVIKLNEPKITIEGGRTWVYMEKGDK